MRPIEVNKKAYNKQYSEANTDVKKASTDEKKAYNKQKMRPIQMGKKRSLQQAI